MPAALEQPLCIVGDAHLGHGEREAVGTALAALVRAHPGHELILNGDSFDSSVEPPDTRPESSIPRALTRHAELARALVRHCERGDRVTFVAGNHDAALARPELRTALLRELGLPETAPLMTEPWLVRRAGVHIEHGHVYDPDNAPTHPLAPWSVETEPLGVALTRRFIAPAGALDFAHSEETTPLAGFLRTFRVHGLRAPAVVLHYYRTAARLAWEAGAQPGLDAERSQGARAVDDHARRAGVDADLLRELALAGARATHHSRLATFQRLYLDRSLATLGLALGLVGLATLGSPAVGVGAVAAAYLGFSVARGVNRYGGQLERRLEDTALLLKERSAARVVVFGHTHRARDRDGYFNPGSFAYPSSEGRGYVLVERDERATLRRWRE